MEGEGGEGGSDMLVGEVEFVVVDKLLVVICSYSK